MDRLGASITMVLEDFAQAEGWKPKASTVSWGGVSSQITDSCDSDSEMDGDSQEQNEIQKVSRLTCMQSIQAGDDFYQPFELHRAWTKTRSQRSASFDNNTTGKRADQLLQDRSRQIGSTHGFGNRSLILRFVLQHPSSPQRLFWEFLSMLVIVADMVIIPLSIIGMPTSILSTCIDWISRLFWTLDIPASIMVGYFHKGHVVMNPKNIWLHYLKTWFVIDAGIVACDWAAYALGNERQAATVDVTKSVRSVRFFRILRLLRLAKVKRIIVLIQDTFDSQAASVVFGFFTQIICILGISHMLACVWFGLGQTDSSNSWMIASGMVDQPFEYKYLTSLHWSLSQFVLGGIDVDPVNTTERAFSVSLLLAALIMFSALIGKVSASVAKIEDLKGDYVKDMWLLLRYLREHRVSRNLTVRIRRYVEYALAHRKKKLQTDEVPYIPLLTDRLRAELNWEMYLGTLTVHPLLKKVATKMPRAVHSVCLMALEELHCPRQDTLFETEECANFVYFPLEGELMYVHAPTGISQQVFEGEILCEVALWTRWHHMGQLRAVLECRLVTLSVKPFIESLCHYEITKNMSVQVGKDFLCAMNKLSLMELTDVFRLPGADEIGDTTRWTWARHLATAGGLFPLSKPVDP